MQHPGSGWRKDTHRADSPPGQPTNQHLISHSKLPLRRRRIALDRGRAELTASAAYDLQERDEKRDLDMAFRLTHDNLQAVATTVFSGFSLIQIFDALRDYVQQDEYNDDTYVGQSRPWLPPPARVPGLLWVALKAGQRADAGLPAPRSTTWTWRC